MRARVVEQFKRWEPKPAIFFFSPHKSPHHVHLLVRNLRHTFISFIHPSMTTPERVKSNSLGNLGGNEPKDTTLSNRSHSIRAAIPSPQPLNRILSAGNVLVKSQSELLEEVVLEGKKDQAMPPAHAITHESVARMLSTNLTTGLTTEEATKRLA